MTECEYVHFTYKVVLDGYASNKMVVHVYAFFSFLLFGFGGGWVGQRKSEHCSDFKNTYTKMDSP